MPSGLTDWMSCSGGSSILCINIYIYLHTYVNIYICLYACVFISIYIYTHTHVYQCHLVAGLLVAKLQEIGGFIWPQAIRSRGVTGQKIFAKGDQNEDIKCSASECLSVYSVFRFFLLEALQTQNLRAIRAECESVSCLGFASTGQTGQDNPESIGGCSCGTFVSLQGCISRYTVLARASLQPPSLQNVASAWDTCVVLVPRREAQRDQATCSVDLQHLERLGEICDGGCRVRHA